MFDLITSGTDSYMCYSVTNPNKIDFIIGDDDIVCAIDERNLDVVIQHLSTMFKVFNSLLQLWLSEVHVLLIS